MHQVKLETVKNVSQSKAKISYPYSIIQHSCKIFDYIAILRPLLLIPVWTMLLLGYYKGIKGDISARFLLPGNIPIILRPHTEIIITLFVYSLLMGAVYILNQITDSDADSVNGKLYLIFQGHVKKDILKTQIVALLSVSIIIAFLRFPRAYLLLVILSIIFGIVYSVPPVRLKGKPFLDLLANATGFGIIAFTVGYISNAKLSREVLIDSLPYFICTSAAFINTTLPDMEGDIRNGDKTTGVILGIRKSCLASTLLLILAIFLSLLNRDFISLTASTASLPFFIYMTARNWNESNPRMPAITLATKFSLLILSILTCIIIPLYFVLLLLTILLMKLYYQRRFGISYP